MPRSHTATAELAGPHVDILDVELVRVEDAIAATVAKFKPKASEAVTPDRFRNAVRAVLGAQPASGRGARLAQHTMVALSALSASRSTAAVDEALERSSDAFAKALRGTGVPADVLTLLQSWLAVQLQARELQLEASFEHRLAQLLSHPARSGSDPAAQQHIADDPMRSLTAGELGVALGNLSDETVRLRERAGELFSVLRPGRKRGREYPAFQAWPGIAGAPLQQVLGALGGLSATDLYGFFGSPTDLIGGLTPVEALMGQLSWARALEDETQAFLKAPMQARLAAVIKAAEALAALRAA